MLTVFGVLISVWNVLENEVTSAEATSGGKFLSTVTMTNIGGVRKRIWSFILAMNKTYLWLGTATGFDLLEDHTYWCSS